MNKLSKRAISIIVIATFLISMIPIMPAHAQLTVIVSGQNDASSFYELGYNGDGICIPHGIACANVFNPDVVISTNI